MKRTFIFAVLIFALCGISSAQTPREVIDKVRQISLLESDRRDVRRILSKYEFDSSDDSSHNDLFDTKDAQIEISYSRGKCSDEAERWNVSEWKTTWIEILLEEPIRINATGIDHSKFIKEKEYVNADSYIYHSKNAGIALQVEDNRVRRIFLFPPRKSVSTPCKNKAAKRFYLSKSWFGSTKLKDRVMIHEPPPPNVTNLTLSAEEITFGSDQAQKISITTVVFNPDNNVLTYRYRVSAGKIIGEGKQVVWDLTGVEPGTYTITAGADDGCGVCGTTKTKTVVVRECPGCGENKKQ